MKSSVFLIIISQIFLFTNCGGGPKDKSQDKQISDSTAIIQNTNKSESRPIINVYLENSGSMNGYVAGVTEFEQSIYSFLSQISTSQITDSLNLYYINSTIHYQGNDIENFIKDLDKSTFQSKGGTLSETIISQLLSQVLNKTDRNSISFFISDCIFSPGRGVNAEEYLVNQRIAIRTMFSKAIEKNPELGVVIFNSSSNFRGDYFNKNNEKRYINSRRPYYLWIIGETSKIKQLLDKVPYNNDKERIMNNYASIFNYSSYFNKYEILLNPKMGDFRKVKSNNPTISKTHIYKTHLEMRSGGKIFMFSVGLNASDLLLDDSYLMNSSNYNINDNEYSVDVKKHNIKNDQGYKYRIELCTDRIHASNIELSLILSIPEWVNELNDETGLDFNSKESSGKTYGIKYVIGGVYDAYALLSPSYIKMNFSVNNN